MKRTILLLAVLALTLSLTAQPWKSKLPANKSKSDLTFFDYQKAFNDYWEPFNLKNGFYKDENGKTQKAHGWKQFKRWEYLWESQIDIKTGEFPNVNPREVYHKWQQTHNTKAPKSANWQVMGPSSSGGGYAGIGRINTIAFHPTDNNTYWIGAPAGGLWKTTDNGSTWTNLTDDNAVLGVSDILFFDDLDNPNTLYIATGDRDAWDNRSIGVLKSTDGGETWNSTDLSYTLQENVMVNRLLADPDDNQTIIAATSVGVYKTVDGGSNWETQLTSIEFKDMEFKPGAFNTMYGATTSGSVYRTTNGGQTWNETLSTGRRRIELAVTPANAAYVYAIVSNYDNGLYGIYKSTDSGASFTQVWDGTAANQNLLGWYGGDDDGGQGFYDLSIAASPIDEDIVLVGGVNTWKSNDGGNSWDLVGHWYGGLGAQATHADKHQLKFRDNGDLFECNDGGVYLSTDNGNIDTWVDKTNGLIISQIYKLSVSQTNDDEVILGLQDNGTKLTYDGNWADVMGGDGMECLIDYTDENIQYGTVYYGAIDRTTNHWQTSRDITPNDAEQGAWVAPYVIDPNNPMVLYAGYEDIYKTTDRGDSWTKISDISSSSKLRSIALSPSNPGVIYTADPYSIYKTIDDGQNWENISNGLPSNSITNIAVKNDDPNTVWVTLGGFDSRAIYETTNGGDTWTDISAGLPELPATSVVQNNLISDEVHLYISTRIGIYFKKGNDNWISYNTNLPNVRVSELEIYYDYENINNSKLRAATYGRGLWESPLYLEETQAPVVATIIASNLTENSVTINGTISNENNETITSSGFLFGTTPDLNSGDEGFIHFPTTPTVSTGEFSQLVSNLEHSTTYYYRAYAINSNGTGYGIIRSFTTVALATYEVSFVIQNGNGQGIFMAQIGINEETLTTSPGGVARINLIDGEYTYDVSAPGYIEYTDIPLTVNGEDQTTLIILSPVGLEKLNDDNFDIYPNPATEIINIHSKGKFTAKLITEDGRLLEQIHSNDNATLFVKDIDPGLYFVQIINNNRIGNQRIIIK
jgi:photosystem II stability/assembly factor-like uncharacterized protein